jgi:hypothetical protein
MQNNINEQFQKLHDRQDSLQSELKKNKSSSKPKFEPVVILNENKFESSITMNSIYAQ